MNPNTETTTSESTVPETVPKRLATLRADLVRLPREVWILCIGMFVNRFGAFVIPFLPLYLTSRGFPLMHAGYALMAYGAGTFLSSLIGGHLADRIGRRKTIGLSMAGAAVTFLMLWQAESLAAILFTSFLVGMASEFYRPACAALLTDLVKPSERIVAFAVYRWAINAGWAFGPATAGLIAEHSYSWLFMGNAISAVLFGVLAWFALPQGVRSTREESNWTIALKSVAQNKRFLQVLVATLGIGFVFFQMSSTYSVHVVGLGYTKFTYGCLIAINGIMIIIFEIPLTIFTQRGRPKVVMALGFFLIGAGFALNAIVLGLPLLALGMVIFTIGEMIAMPVLSAYVANLSPKLLRGRYMGLLGFTFSLALVTGPAAGMWVYERSPETLWILCGVFGMLGGWVMTWKNGD